MRLADLAGIGGDSRVTGFAIDHRKVAPGTVFGAFRGKRFNGEDFIPQAVGAGAVAVVARPEATVEGAAHIAVRSRGANSPGWRRNSSGRSRKRRSPSPAPTARRRASS
jgi:UDP-N-acetylmuramyl tripeptide synthase